MREDDVKRIVRGLIADYGLAWSLVDVMTVADGWTVTVRAASHETICFHVSADRPPALRREVKAVLDRQIAE
jgi:hypothetical protein